MNAETKVSSFPPSVQPGMPRLGRLPNGWTKAPLSRFLKEVRRPLKMGDDTEYRLVTVKRSRGGVVERSVLAGREISVKSQFYVRSGDFLISKRQIVHGACALVPNVLDGSIVSNEYAVLNGNGKIDLKFLSYTPTPAEAEIGVLTAGFETIQLCL
jgi:type I restriction enzyme S subunit